MLVKVTVLNWVRSQMIWTISNHALRKELGLVSNLVRGIWNQWCSEGGRDAYPVRYSWQTSILSLLLMALSWLLSTTPLQYRHKSQAVFHSCWRKVVSHQSVRCIWDGSGWNWARWICHWFDKKPHLCALISVCSLTNVEGGGRPVTKDKSHGKNTWNNILLIMGGVFLEIKVSSVPPSQLEKYSAHWGSVHWIKWLVSSINHFFTAQALIGWPKVPS